MGREPERVRNRSLEDQLGERLKPWSSHSRMTGCRPGLGQWESMWIQNAHVLSDSHVPGTALGSGSGLEATATPSQSFPTVQGQPALQFEWLSLRTKESEWAFGIFQHVEYKVLHVFLCSRNRVYSWGGLSSFQGTCLCFVDLITSFRTCGYKQ